MFGGNALYASVAVAASAVMVIASALGSPTIGIVAAVVLSLLLRWGAVRWGWGLPNGREWQPQSTLASLLRRGRGLRPDPVRLLRRPGRRPGTRSVHTDDDHSTRPDVVPIASTGFPGSDATSIIETAGYRVPGEPHPGVVPHGVFRTPWARRDTDATRMRRYRSERRGMCSHRGLHRSARGQTRGAAGPRAAPH